jgi:hypothetical protein
VRRGEFFAVFLSCFSERRAQRGVRISGAKKKLKQISGIYMFSWLIISGLGVLRFKKIAKSRVAALVILSGYFSLCFCSQFGTVQRKAVPFQ